MYFIQPTIEQIDRALESWHWIGIEKIHPFAVTAFGDMFFEKENAIWFLDTIEGSFLRMAANKNELDKILRTEEGQDRYLLAGLVMRARAEGMNLAEGQSYDFKLNPKLGGAIEFENVQPQNFVVAVHIAGQINQQIRSMPNGMKINNFVVVDD